MISAAFINLKPGTTKTTSAIWLAAALHALGLRTLLVGADRGGSLERWAEEAGGFPWATLSIHRRSIGRELPQHVRQGKYEALVVDCPQMEDHADVAMGAMTACDTWIVPVAPAGIEVDRTAMITPQMDAADAIRPESAERLIFFTRTNRRELAKSGVDLTTRETFEAAGLPVFIDQVPKNAKDDMFRASFGYVPDASGTAYESLARYLSLGGRDPHGFAEMVLAERREARHAAVYGA